MKQRLVIITEIISPYRIPLFNALAQRGDLDVQVLFLAETDPGLREWRVYKEEIRFSHEVLPSWRKRVGGHNMLINAGVAPALDRASPDVILCGGYNYPASWLSLLWARQRNIPFVLWSESVAQDLRPGLAVLELLKSEFLRQCNGFVVPGRSAHEYLRSLKIKKEYIFTAVNAVDNDLFCQGSQRARSTANLSRKEMKLPQRYFLFVGRLVREKGVFELLSAYAKLEKPLREEVGLVFVGDGHCRQELEQLAREIVPGKVSFAGFVQRDQLPTYYALAEMLILPTYTDTWGLVVNEAMACGLPVILSQAAGCAADLVTDDWNGRTVAARDESALRIAMRSLAADSALRAELGSNSRRRIAGYSAQNWCEGIARMMSAVGRNFERAGF